jgi:ribosome-binding protein aMBF1 (putative translation factor)
MKPDSAPTTLETAPNAVAQPREARVAFRLTESEAGTHGLLERWRLAIKKRQIRQEKRIRDIATLNGCVSRLIIKAEEEGWSQRQLAAKIQIPETTFRRIRDQKVEPLIWLPKIMGAMSKLQI